MKTLKRILHVEDDQDILNVAGICLKNIGGFEVTQYTSGRMAVENSGANQPDLFLLDMMMPDMDGIETLKKLRQCKHLSEVPVIFITAKDAKSKKTLSQADSNMIGIIEKPFDAVYLARDISKMWCKHQYLAN